MISDRMACSDLDDQPSNGYFERPQVEGFWICPPLPNSGYDRRNNLKVMPELISLCQELESKLYFEK